jgi:hypothetical protein
MILRKTSKVMAGITSTALMLGISGCSTNSDSYVDTNNVTYEDTTSSSYDTDASSDYSTDTSSDYVSDTDSGYDPSTSSDIDSDTNVDSLNSDNPPDDPNCSGWDWDDEDGIWQCADSESSYYGHSYYGGRYYANKSLLYNSNDFMAYKSSSSFKGGMSSTGGTSSDPVKRSSGFGSGSNSFGG